MKRKTYDTSGFDNRTVGEALAMARGAHSRSRSYSHLLTAEQLAAAIWKMEQIKVRIEAKNDYPWFKKWPYKRKVANNTSLRTFFNRIEKHLEGTYATAVVTSLDGRTIVHENTVVGDLRTSYGFQPGEY